MPSAFQTEKVEIVTIFNFFARNNQMASEKQTVLPIRRKASTKTKKYYVVET